MNWIVAHAYIVILSIIGFSVIAGSAVLYERRAEPVGVNANWGRTGGLNLFNVGQSTQTRDRVEKISESLEPNTEYQYIPIQTSLIPEDATLPDEWESLLTQLTQPPAGNTGQDSVETSGAYSFIPTGLVSTEEPTEQKTKLQTELFEYGNRVGSHIRAFEDMHKNMLTTLRDAYSDRANATKRTAAEDIGLDYEQLGKDLEAIEDVPVSVAKMHAAIAASYKEAGQKMIVKLRAQSDDDFVAAMHSYNDAALEFTNNFVALATYLSAAGVKFSTSDAGSVFTFSPM